jgi:hypothetical protein
MELKCKIKHGGEIGVPHKELLVLFLSEEEGWSLLNPFHDISLFHENLL